MSRIVGFSLTLVGLVLGGSGCPAAPVAGPGKLIHHVDECAEFSRNEAHELLLDRQHVHAVETLIEEPFVPRPTPLKVAAAKQRAKVLGARLTLHPAAGVTQERLQRLAECDRVTALKTGGEQVASCPFELSDSSTSTTSTGDGFAIDVVSSDPATAKEIVRRATALVR